MKHFFGFDWAQPVVSHRKAVWCSILSLVSKLPFVNLAHRKHMAWQRACGIS
jgi:hypothetical protein